MSLAHQDSDFAFWERHLRISVGLYALCNVFVWVYAALTLSRPHRPLMVGIAVSGLLVAVVVVDRLRGRIVRSRHRHTLLYGWSALSYLFVSVGAYLDGGPRSPMVLLLFVTMGYVALAYPPAAVLAFSILAVVAYAVVAVARAGNADGAQVLLEACIITLIGVLASLAAENQWRTRRALVDMAARLERLALIDLLTGCLNRWAVWDRLASELARSDRDGTFVSLLMVDVDRLKVINDAHGHLVGDKVLEGVGAALLQSVRACDSVGRVGGDEFVVILPETRAAAAHGVAQRLLDAVHALELNVPVVVTVSVGLAERGARGADIEGLFEAADRSLYVVKAAGRNAVAPVRDEPSRHITA